MPKVWKSLLFLSILLMSISSAAAHDSSIEIETNSGFSIVEQSGESDDASVRVIPDEGLAGTTHTILISGLNDGEEIAVSILYDGEEVYSTGRTADSRGRVEVEIFTELTDPVGDYSIEVLNANGVLIGSDSFTVIEPSGLTATLEINPTEAEAGTTFTLNISDVKPFVDLRLVFRDADGITAYSTVVRADAEGVAIAEFPTEEIAAGTYSVSVVLESDTNVEVATDEVTVLQKAFTVTTSLDPAETRPNREISISIDGLEAESTATIDILGVDGESIHSEEITADENGTASLVYTLPEDAELGDYTVQVMQAGELVSEASFVLFVPEFAVSISPENGTPNTNFLVEIIGLDENETAKVELVNAEGVLQSIDVNADIDGNATALLGQRLRLELGTYAIRVMRGDTVAFGQPINITEQFESSQSDVEPENIIVTVNPESGSVPTDYTFRIEGLDPDTDVTMRVLFDGSEIYSTTGTTDDNGVFETIATSEPSDSEGTYVVEFRVSGEVVGSAEFFIGEPPADTDEPDDTDETTETDETTDDDAVAIHLNPSAVLQGERVEILVNNLEANETVTIEIRYGEDTVYSAEREASDIGAIGIAVRIEDADPTGVYGIVVLRGEEIIANAALNVVQDESSLPESLPEISITPESGPIGTDHIIEITGLNAEESLEISLEFEGEEVLNLERSADSTGKVVVVIGSELNDSPGEYAIVVLREDGTELSSALVIEDSILMGAAEITIEPQSGPIETDHRITVSGLLPNEDVTLDIEFEDDVVFTTERTADENGIFVIDITSQEGDEYGEYDVIVRRDNGDESSISFIVESPVPFEVIVEPDVIGIGDGFNIVVSGLNAGENVSMAIVVNDEVVFETEGQADDEGNLVFDLFSEEGDSIGATTVVITRENGETASADFELLESSSEIAITVEPDRGPIETDYEFAITGLDANETYNFAVEYDGEVVYSATVEADNAGKASIVLTSQEGDAIGDYRLVILSNDVELASIEFEVTGDDIIEDTPTEQTPDSPIVAVDSTVYRGRINADTGELVFTFSGDAGQEMLIGLSSNEFDTYLILQDEHGQELAVNDNYGDGSNSQISSYALPYSGEYRVVVSSADYQGELETVFGNFVLLIEPFNSIAGEYGETVTVAFDETTISQFIQFEGRAGDVISIAVDSGGTVDTILSVLSPSDVVLIQDDDGGLGYDSEINRLVLTESGIYTVIVRSFVFGKSGEADVTIHLNGSQILDKDTRLVELSSKQNSDVLVFSGQAGETITLSVALESGNTTSLHILAEQYGIALVDYQTVALPDRITLSFIVPDNGLVTIYVEDAAADYVGLWFAIERE